MPWKEIEENLAENNVLYTANLYAVFDKADALVKIFSSFSELDSFLNARASNLEAGKLEKMRLSRVNCGAFELAEILNLTAKISGANGYEIILVSDAGWFAKTAHHPWVHTVPPVTVVSQKQA